MTYTLTLSVGEDAERLYKAVQPEHLQTPRAKVEVKYENNVVIFSLIAKDFTAFRAMESAILRLLTIYTKMRTLTNNEL